MKPRQDELRAIQVAISKIRTARVAVLMYTLGLIVLIVSYIAWAVAPGAFGENFSQLALVICLISLLIWREPKN